MASDPVWSIIWMIGILLVGTGVAIYYIFMYDVWYPNEQSEVSSHGSTSREITGEAEGAY